MLTSKVSSLYAGGTGRLEPEGHLSGIFKRPLFEGAEITALGIAGDEHCDPRVHGGPEKAVHQFAVENYGRLAQHVPVAKCALVPGSIGENLSAAGMTESNVCIGDVFQVGSAILQVSQPRSPCWKIDHRFGVEGMSRVVLQERMTGWYFRVLQSGFVRAGDRIELAERQTQTFSIEEFWSLQASHRPSVDELRNLASVPGLADAWKRKLDERVTWLHKLAS